MLQGKTTSHMTTLKENPRTETDGLEAGQPTWKQQVHSTWRYYDKTNYGSCYLFIDGNLLKDIASEIMIALNFANINIFQLIFRE